MSLLRDAFKLLGRLHRHESFTVNDPLPGVVRALFGSDSHVTAPLNLRIYLYSMFVLAGTFTVTRMKIIRVAPRKAHEVGAHYSKLDTSPRTEAARCPGTSSSAHQRCP